MITFKAKLVNHVYVNVRNSDGNVKRKKVSFVELDPREYRDYNLVVDTAGRWGFNAPIACDIVRDMSDCAGGYCYYDEKFFALTGQKNFSRSLDPANILGLIETSRDTHSIGGKYINYLQVKPEYCGSQKNKKAIYNIGRKILKSVEKLFKNCDIYVTSIPCAIGFYEKCGFKLIDNFLGTVMVKQAKKALKL